MRDEDTLREALRSLERHAPDLDTVLIALPGANPGERHRRAPRRRWPRAGGPVLIALAVVASVVTPLTLTGFFKNEIHNAPSVPASPNAAARVFLDSAATRLAATPAPAPGAYWQVTTVQGDLYVKGPNSRPYAVELRSAPMTVWYSDQPKRQVLSVPHVGYTAAPATPAATAAWRADGSPTLYAGKDYSPQLPPGQLWWGLQFYSVAKFQRLPETADALKAAIKESLVEPNHPTGVTFTEPEWIATNPDVSFTPGTAGYDRFVFAMCLDLLDHEPVTPQVKAAALRVMATLPEVRLVGEVTDSLGRAGYAITMPNAFMISNGIVTGDQKPQLQIILSSAGVLLGEQWVATRLPAGIAAAPPSGGAPGPVKCPGGTTPYAALYAASHGAPHAAGGLTECIQGKAIKEKGKDGRTITIMQATPLKPGEMPVPVILDQPVLAVAPGTVTLYQAIVSAQWTDTAPPPSATLVRQ